MRNLQYEIRICQKAIIKSQRQFMFGSIFNASDVMYTISICRSEGNDVIAKREKSYDESQVTIYYLGT